MTVVNYTEARNNLKHILDTVVDNADYTVINRRDADDAVV
ncbi:MAG: type II toxin-antitoxin system Phd/YefM family antitoxin, partial [Campylobacterota bacterium]|nr:type II toxin-antitoxin system Phd/YefM family antitoxin [Campylobacterota bacterium]